MNTQAPVILTINFLRENIGREFIYHLRGGKEDVFIMTEYMLEMFEENETHINRITPNF